MQGAPGPEGSTHGYETNAIAKVPGTMANTDVISISGVADGSYIVSAQINAFSINPGQFIYCSLYDGKNQTGYTIEDETSANLDVTDP